MSQTRKAPMNQKVTRKAFCFCKIGYEFFTRYFFNELAKSIMSKYPTKKDEIDMQ